MTSSLDQLNRLARQWHVSILNTQETYTSLVAFGLRDNARVVIKLSKQQGDEWNSGAVLRAFDGDGVVRVIDSKGGAVLLEELVPGHNLVGAVTQGNDETATKILAQVITKMANHEAPTGCPNVLAWSKGFTRYREMNAKQIPSEMVDHAEALYLKLAASSSRTMLLHGDLHHYNVVFDEKRGWTAIDPKGIVGELEFEVGAILRNPVELPQLLTSRKVIERRLQILTDVLDLDYQRALEWCFAQAVLSVIWDIEDRNEARSSTLILAEVLRPILRDGPKSF